MQVVDVRLKPGFVFICFQNTFLLMGFLHRCRSTLINREAPSWMNHIYYRWATTTFPLPSHTALPLEYCLFTALTAGCHKAPMCVAQTYCLQMRAQACRNSPCYWHLNSPAELTWARFSIVSIIQFILSLVSGFLAVIPFKIHHCLYCAVLLSCPYKG